MSCLATISPPFIFIFEAEFDDDWPIFFTGSVVPCDQCALGFHFRTLWTDLKLAQQVLARAGYRRRSLRKKLITGDVDPHERDQQFRLIATLRRQARARSVPVLCLDTKKKERLGHLHRLGSCYSTDVQFVYDHDYHHLATGVLVPHGAYDCHDNAGFITFVCDAIALAWQEDRAEHYPHAQEILLTFHAGGANAARSLRFKEGPVPLSRRLGLRLRVATTRRTPPSGIRSSTVCFVMSSVA